MSTATKSVVDIELLRAPKEVEAAAELGSMAKEEFISLYFRVLGKRYQENKVDFLRLVRMKDMITYPEEYVKHGFDALVKYFLDFVEEAQVRTGCKKTRGTK